MRPVVVDAEPLFTPSEPFLSLYRDVYQHDEAKASLPFKGDDPGTAPALTAGQAAAGAGADAKGKGKGAKEERAGAREEELEVVPYLKRKLGEAQRVNAQLVEEVRVRVRWRRDTRDIHPLEGIVFILHTSTPHVAPLPRTQLTPPSSTAYPLR